MRSEAPAFLNRAHVHQVASTVAALVIVGLLGILDFVTGYELSFSIFYLAPVSLAGWYVGRRGGFIVAIASAAVWLVAV